MNLLEIRTKFREISGRYDLVNDDYSDNGADFYINEGRKFLDKLDETQKSWASQFRFVQIGQYSASVQYCRAIKEVWAMTTSARWQLEKVDLQDMIAGYMTGLPSARNTGSPLYYTPTITRYNPSDALPEDIQSFIGWVEISSGKVEEYNTILINVPTSELLSLEIKGLFYSPKLVEDTDTNHWSVNHPMLLIRAAMRELEINNRNTQGANDWTNAITTDMKLLGMDLVEELIAGVSQIED